MEVLVFMSASCDTVKDQITFMYSRKLMIEVALEQHDKPMSRLLAGYGVADGTQ